MSFLKKIFASKDPLGALRRAVQQQRWADALVEGEFVQRTSLSAELQTELEAMLSTAGDSLAAINLAEGDAFLNAGDRTRAREHFSLAASQARDPDLREKARERLSAPSSPVVPSVPAPPISTSASCCPEGCGNGVTTESEDLPAPDLDDRTRLDLLLSAYPEPMAARYESLQGTFLSAFLLAHEGRETEALEGFEQVPEADRNDLFYFERGSLLARLGKTEEAAADLELARELNPNLELAREILVNLDLLHERFEEAEARLQQMLEEGGDPAFCHGRLAAISAERGDVATALEYALSATGSGNADPETCLLAANLLERSGRLQEAEACLSRLNTPGCGGLNPALAEFWLRHRQHAEKALETFKGALRQEPGNPRWRLRIAQAYLACGWRKEGIALLEQALSSPGLAPDLYREGSEWLEKST